MVDGSCSFNSRVLRTGVLHSARETLEDGLNLVMVGPSIQDLRVKIRAGVIHKTAEEIFEQLRLQIADHSHSHSILVDQRRPSAEVERHDGERLIHWQYKVSGAIDAATVPQSTGE